MKFDGIVPSEAPPGTLNPSIFLLLSNNSATKIPHTKSPRKTGKTLRYLREPIKNGLTSHHNPDILNS
jgi:hypothetical protein